VAKGEPFAWDLAIKNKARCSSLALAISVADRGLIQALNLLSSICRSFSGIGSTGN